MRITLCACGCHSQLRLARYPSQQSKWMRGHAPQHWHRLENIAGRFWRSVTKSRRRDGCWTVCRERKRLRVRGRRMRASRLAWELTHGPIPVGLFVLHTCDNGACVRPTHLFLGTQADNVADMVTKGRQAVGELHGKAKLTNAEVLRIKQRLAAGIKPPIIAAEFCVSRTSILDIRSGRTWAAA